MNNNYIEIPFAAELERDNREHVAKHFVFSACVDRRVSKPFKRNALITTPWRKISENSNAGAFLDMFSVDWYRCKPTAQDEDTYDIATSWHNVRKIKFAFPYNNACSRNEYAGISNKCIGETLRYANAMLEMERLSIKQRYTESGPYDCYYLLENTPNLRGRRAMICGISEMHHFDHFASESEIGEADPALHAFCVIVKLMADDNNKKDEYCMVVYSSNARLSRITTYKEKNNV